MAKIYLKNACLDFYLGEQIYEILELGLLMNLSLQNNQSGILTYALSKDLWMETGYDEDDLFHFLED